MKKIILLFVLLALASCHKKDDNSDVPEAIAGKDFDLELIDSLPQNLIDGCGEYLTHDSIKGIALKYLFVSDLTESGMIRIDGKNIRLQKDTIRSRDIDAKNYIEYYKNNDIEVIIRLKEVEKYEEGGFNEGTLNVTRNHIEKTYKVKGDSGC